MAQEILQRSLWKAKELAEYNALSHKQAMQLRLLREQIDGMFPRRLYEYRSTVKKETQTEVWDELERSVIASTVDDAIAGVKGRKADIIIVKNRLRREE